MAVYEIVPVKTLDLKKGIYVNMFLLLVFYI